MELIERYLQAIGRQLPAGQRADILSELRSALMDKLEAQYGAAATEDAAARVIQEMGAPKKVAAAYYAEGQYLIGPALFPTFKLVVGIVLAAVIGAQLLALGIQVIIGREPLDWLEALGGIVNSLPAALGMVGLAFALLQRYGVQPDLADDDAFDPRQLPALEGAEPVRRGELIFGAFAGGFGLAFLTQFALRGGFRAGGLFANPVMDQYFLWVALSMAVSLMLDVWLLWQGRWHTLLRLAKLASEVFSLAVLFGLIQGHTAWLATAGVGGFFDSVRQLSQLTEATQQAFGMAAFQLALTVAFVVTLVDTLVQVYRLIRTSWTARQAKTAGGGQAPLASQ